MATYIVHETYEYYIEADTSDQALELFHEQWEDGKENPEGVSFTQNYLHIYNTDMEEL